MRWLVAERPQVASVFHHGKVIRFEGNVVEIEFDAPIYAEMVMEPDRKKQIDGLIQQYFKRPLTLTVAKSQNGGSAAPKAAWSARLFPCRSKPVPAQPALRSP